MADKKLSEKQIAFCQEYIIDFNGTQAARRAGYSEKTANEQASATLAKPEVQEYLAELIKERSERTQITADNVLKELALIGFSNVDDFEIDDYGRVTLKNTENTSIMRCISSIKRKTKQIGPVKEYEVEVKFWNKNDALNRLGMHLGIFEKDNKQKQVLIRTFEISPASNQ